MVYGAIVGHLFAEIPKHSDLNFREAAKLRKKKKSRKCTWGISDYAIRCLIRQLSFPILYLPDNNREFHGGARRGAPASREVN